VVAAACLISGTVAATCLIPGTVSGAAFILLTLNSFWLIPYFSHGV